MSFRDIGVILNKAAEEKSEEGGIKQQDDKDAEKDQE